MVVDPYHLFVFLIMISCYNGRLIRATDINSMEFRYGNKYILLNQLERGYIFDRFFHQLNPLNIWILHFQIHLWRISVNLDIATKLCTEILFMGPQMKSQEHVPWILNAKLINTNLVPNLVAMVLCVRQRKMTETSIVSRFA